MSTQSLNSWGKLFGSPICQFVHIPWNCTRTKSLIPPIIWIFISSGMYYINHWYHVSSHIAISPDVGSCHLLLRWDLPSGLFAFFDTFSSFHCNNNYKSISIAPELVVEMDRHICTSWYGWSNQVHWLDPLNSLNPINESPLGRVIAGNKHQRMLFITVE